MRSLPQSSVGVSGGYSVLAECGQDGGVGYAEMLSDPGEGPAELVEVDGGLDLVGGQAAAAHRHMVPVEDSADRASFDAESGGQFIHCGPGLVAGDQFRDSVGVQLACPPRSGPFRRRLGGCRGVGQLLDQGFQGFYLRVRVRVGSPKVHSFYAGQTRQRCRVFRLSQGDLASRRESSLLVPPNVAEPVVVRPSETLQLRPLGIGHRRGQIHRAPVTVRCAASPALRAGGVRG